MPCYHPLQGYRAKGGRNNGKWSITFSPSQGHPDLKVQVPCGQCLGCRLEKSRQWALRCTHEMRQHEDNCFITLTFDEDNIDKNFSLVKSDYQNFMKRLRKNTKAKIRYFHCGEYGEKFLRPHHHAILFGYDFPDKKYVENSNKKNKSWNNKSGGYKLYQSDILDKAWQYQGKALIGEANFDSAAYVARYILKKQTGPGADDYYQGRLPEYVTMSRGGKGGKGIGYNHYKEYKDEIYRDDTIVINNKKMRPPKYYDNQFETENPQAFETTKNLRYKNASQFEDFNDYFKLPIKEHIQKARQGMTTRQYETSM